MVIESEPVIEPVSYTVEEIVGTILQIAIKQNSSCIATTPSPLQRQRRSNKNTIDAAREEIKQYSAKETLINSVRPEPVEGHSG